ncbi:MAG: arginine repressor [Lachnospiraceae bacterium]|nr:arginine repressor [Lachnospiraceae bacterium]
MKNARQTQIIRLIEKYHIETQEELADRLNESGFQVTQATVSRDIRELHLIKVSDGQGKSRYSIIQNDVGHLSKKYSRVLKDAYVSMDTAGNLLVMKTVPGMAMAAAAALDSLGWPEILGCIAGDDTIMCAIHSPQDAKVVMGKLMKIIEG